MGCGTSSTKKQDTVTKEETAGKETGSDLVLKVTLIVFSGRPHPTWEIKSDHPKYKELLTMVDTHGEEDDFPDFVLGYRGFHVEKVSVERPQDASAVGATPAAEVPSKKVKSSIATELQEMLLDTATDVEEEVVAHVKENIGKAIPEVTIDDAALTIDAGVKGPPYEPAKWNEDWKVIRNNNCYNYSNNMITNSFAQPGKASNDPYGRIAGDQLQKSSESDGLKFIDVGDDAAIPEPSDGHVIALVIWPGIDFHWYRRDNTGQWSHKPGATKCTNLDSKGVHIEDPRTCDRGGYSEFTCFMESVPDHVTIK